MIKHRTKSSVSERRTALRTPADDQMLLFSSGSMIGQAHLIEQSANGLKLTGRPELIRASDKVLSVALGKGYEVEVMWSAGAEAGLWVTKARRLWGVFAEPDFEPLRAAWLRAGIQ